MTLTQLLSLTAKQRRFLRALAHPRKSVVQVGVAGVTPGVLSAITSALQTHELIKVKVRTDCEADMDEIASSIAQGSRCAVAQVIGRTLVIYRPRAEDPVIHLPDNPDDREDSE